MTQNADHTLFVYWIPGSKFEEAKSSLTANGYRLKESLLTPCQVLKAEDRTVRYTPPKLWNRLCNRQGSWYRSSQKNGEYLVVSSDRLPEPLATFLDCQMNPSEFTPDELPSEEQLIQLTTSDEYTASKPGDWESVWLKDAVMFKMLFSVTRFWGRGDTLKKHWLGQRANHANFLAKTFSAEIDGEQVPHSVTGNAGICSSCVEFFNLVSESSRKLVRACPGAVIFGGAQRQTYYDIVPSRNGSRT
jgi:hypothetical protein